MHFLIYELTKINSLIWGYYLKVLFLDEAFDVEAWIDWVVAFDEFFVVVFGW